MRRPRVEPLSLVDGLLSDALGERYGPISARVVRHDAHEREAHLVDAKGVTRTFSLTFLARPMPAPLRALNEEVRRGRLIGEAFRDHGFAIRKNLLDVFTVEIPRRLRAAFRVSHRYAWSRILEFHARRGASAPLVYGTLCEVFTPDFKPPLVKPEDLARLGAATPELLARGLSREAVWQRIGRLDHGIGIEGRYFRARIATLDRVSRLRKRVTELLGGPTGGRRR